MVFRKDAEKTIEVVSMDCKSFAQILPIARSTLRCVEFRKMSIDLMLGETGCGQQSAISDWSTHSRLAKNGEAIEFFISHSWHNCGKMKGEVLTRLGQSFEKLHSQQPIFWLDKLCIDHTKIKDGLRCLPVCLMACQRVLVPVGET